ncbi:MAG: YicC family protein [Beijerinckiaceae bacterium]|nr:YicC family protein [Beijerinckiaceae bacterium]
MTLSSMTGFARVTGAVGDASWAIEIKTVNAKALDVKLRLPSLIEAIEPHIRTIIARSIPRGACQMQISLTRSTGEMRFKVNEAALEELHATFSTIAARLGTEPVPLSRLIDLKGVLEYEERNIDEAALLSLQRAVLDDVESAVAALVVARQVEGAALRGILLGRVERIEQLVRAADELPSRRPEAVQARLSAAVQQLFADISLDEQRLYQEAALLVTRADIREELDRLYTHVKAARALLGESGPVGRKLDFLAQEFGRESNTLCAKSNDAALTAIGLDLKGVVEQFREQIQNVE